MDLLDTKTVEASIDATAPRGRLMLRIQAVLMVAVVTLMVYSLAGPRLGLPTVIGMVLPPIVIAAALLGGYRASRRRRSIRNALSRAWQHVQLDEPQAALAALTPIMHRPISSDSDRGQAYMLLASAAERSGRFDTAGQIYEALLLNRIGEMAHLQEAQIKLAHAKVRNDELTDAVTLISRLAQVPMPGPLKAAFELVHLFQQVFMGHHADAIQQELERRALYRKHLSTKAGYGYGLLAAAMHHLGRTVDAARLWLDATTLIRAERLVQEYPLLAPISRTYPSSEWPL